VPTFAIESKKQIRYEKDNWYDDVGIPMCLLVANGNGEAPPEQKQGSQGERPGEGNRYG
jgi:hypothetical protein